jgi:hypothetical protein
MASPEPTRQASILGFSQQLLVTPVPQFQLAQIVHDGLLASDTVACLLRLVARTPAGRGVRRLLDDQADPGKRAFGSLVVHGVLATGPRGLHGFTSYFGLAPF